MDEAVAGGLNASEPIQANAFLYELAAPAPAQSTPIPPVGIAATLGPNQTHVYSLDISQVNYTLSLSECARQPMDLPPLTLSSGTFFDSTEDGGLLSVSNFTLFNSTIVVSAPASSVTTLEGTEAQWTYQIGLDTSASLAGNKPSLYLVDTDFGNSLFVTMDYQNLSLELQGVGGYENFVNYTDLKSTTHKFHLYLRPLNQTYADVMANGISNDVFSPLYRSFCAMEGSALLNQNNCDFSTTNRGTNDTNTATRGQFLFKGLNRSSVYGVQLAIPPPAGSSLGGILFPPVPFMTKNSTSCQLIYNMTTCPNTAFSVPGNASVFTTEDLTELYDNYVSAYYKNFTRALDQVNCNATKKDRYSVFSTCDDCANAYRDWLCTVAVPRCADWSSPANYLVERPINSSRNNMINDIIRPGAYKEIMPCYWLCNNLVTYCPISMGFSCPSGNLLNMSYGFPSTNGDISCSYPGAVYSPDAALLAVPSLLLVLFCTLVSLLL